MRSDSVCAVLCVLLLVSVASAAHTRTRRDGTNHDLTTALTKAFVSTQGDTADAGADAKAADLTDSIQGLFDDSPDAPDAPAAPAKTQPVAAPPAPEAPKKSPPAVVKAPEQKTEVVQAKPLAKVAKLNAEAVQAKHVSKDVKAKATVVKAKQVPTVVKGKAPVVEAKHVAKVAKVNAKVVKVTQKAFLKAAKAAPLKAAPAVKPAAKTSEFKVNEIAKTESQAKPATKAKKALHAKPVAPAQKVVQVKATVMTTKKAEAKLPVKDTKVSKAPQSKAPLSKGPIIAKVQVAEKAGQSSAGVPVTMIHKAATVAAKTVGVKKGVAKTVVAKKGAADTAAAKIDTAKTVAAKTNEATTAAAKTVTAKKGAAKTVAAKVVAAKTANTQEVATKVAVAKTVAAKTVVAKTAAATTVAGKTAVAKTAATKAKAAFGPWSGKHDPAAAKNSTRTKAIEDAVVSLPMASFALGDTKAVVVTTPAPKKFPGNATQKAAWEKRAQALESELATLKDRLANTSKAVEANKAVVPKAIGSFSVPQDAQDAPDPKAHESDAGAKNDKPSAKFMASKVPAPTQPILNDDKPKAVAAPVPVKAVAAVPTKTEEEEEEVDMDALKAISQSYQHEPAKAASTLETEAHVEHGTEATEDESSAIESKIKAATVIEDTDSAVSATSSTSSLWGWFSSFFSWGSGSPSSTVVAKKQVAPVASLMDVTETHWDDAAKKKRWEAALRTAQATKDEGQHIIQVNDAWSHMEQDDIAEQDQVRSEDQAERERAETAEMPHALSKAELQQRHGVHGVEQSSFWGSLEKEDSGIEHSIDKDDMGEYVRLTKQQADEVVEASKHVQSSPQIAGKAHPLKHNDDARLAIHEPWARREKRDIALEQKVHDSPDLQMLQLQHQHKRK